MLHESRRECFSSLARALPLFSHGPHSKQEDIINTLQFLNIRGKKVTSIFNTTHMWQCFVEFAQYKQQNLEIPGEFICNQFCSSFYLKASLIAQNNIHKNYFCRSKFLISLLLSLLIMYHMNKHSSNIYWSVSLKLL